MNDDIQHIKAEINGSLIIKKVFFPTFLEFIVLFAITITDILFLKQVSGDLINVFAIFSALGTITVLHTQHFSNLAVGTLYSSNKKNFGSSYMYILALNTAITFCYVVVYSVFSRRILSYGGVSTTNPSTIVYFNLMVISLMFRCPRKLPIALDFMIKKAQNNLYFSMMTFFLNIVFNVLAWYYYKTHNNNSYLFAIGIGLSTVLSHALTIIVHLIFQRSSFTVRIIPTNRWRELFQSVYTASISSIEVIAYSVYLYIFLGALAHISPNMYLYRNTIAPFFLFATASSIAWAHNMNRVSFLIQNTIPHSNTIHFKVLLHNTLRNSVLSSVLIAGILSSILAVNISIAALTIKTMICIILLLVIIETIQSINLNTLALLRSLHSIKYSVIFSICSLLITSIIVLILRNQSDEESMIGGFILIFILIGESSIRTVINFLLVKFKINTILFTPS